MQENIDDILKRFVQDQLSPARIVDVHSEEAEDHDGDPIMRIRVVYEYEAGKNRLDPKKIASLVRQLREPLNSLPTVERFPILSFMIPEEVEDATT